MAENKEDNTIDSVKEQTGTQRKYGFIGQNVTKTSKKKFGFVGDDKTSAETLFGMK